MKTIRFLLIGLALAGVAAGGCASAPAAAGQPTRVLVVTGGHDFEHDPFFQVFKDNTNITFQAVAHPQAHALLTADAAKQWDVLVLYDMHQEITEQAKADFIARLKAGKGLVVLHHAIASYQAWPEYAKIIGARYYLQPTRVQGVEKPPSTYQHGVHFHIQVLDHHHPVTRGVSDYDILDETYNGFDVAAEVHPLLGTDEKLSRPVLGWSKAYAGTRVVYLQSGHDHTAYENPNYRQILGQAIQWVARKN